MTSLRAETKNYFTYKMLIVSETREREEKNSNKLIGTKIWEKLFNEIQLSTWMQLKDRSWLISFEGDGKEMTSIYLRSIYSIE